MNSCNTFLKVYFIFEGERERESEQSEQSEGDTGSEAGSMLTEESWMLGSNSRTMRS